MKPSTYIPNTIVWLVVLFALSYIVFSKSIKFLLRKLSLNVKQSNRNRLIRSLWQIIFFSTVCLFLYQYEPYMLKYKRAMVLVTGRRCEDDVQVPDNTVDTTMLERYTDCKFPHHLYDLLIEAFHIHGVLLYLLNGLYINAIQDIALVGTLICLCLNGYEKYFVALNKLLTAYCVTSEVMSIAVLKSTSKLNKSYTVYLVLHLMLWCQIFINVIPFHFLMPLMTLQTNVPLKFIHCLWYIITVWNSPLLRYVYHFMYHSNPVNNTNELECPANGVGIRCIVLQDSREYRHLCFLSEAYKLVKKSQQELLNPNCMDMKLPTGKANNNEANIRMQKCLQTLKALILLKKKAKRFREMKQNQLLKAADDAAAEVAAIMMEQLKEETNILSPITHLKDSNELSTLIKSDEKLSSTVTGEIELPLGYIEQQ